MSVDVITGSFTDLADNANTTDTAADEQEYYQSPAGQDVIDLGEYGLLIAPVNVDGNWYYYWDRSGDGTSANSGTLNGGKDYTTHDVLDNIFKYDINGNMETADNAVGVEGDTDNTFRYATLNGVKVAVPTQGDAGGTSSYRPGTAIDNSPVGEDNPIYDDLLAIWDGYNGSGTEAGVINNGTPSGWDMHNYWSATPSDSGHASVALYNGYVSDRPDVYPYHYVALQVL